MKKITINTSIAPYFSGGDEFAKKIKKSLTKPSNWCIIYSKAWHCLRESQMYDRCFGQGTEGLGQSICLKEGKGS